MSLKKIVILFSGEGSNLENLIKKLNNTHVNIVAVITNNPNAKGIKKAENLCVEVIVINHKEYNSREEFDTKLVECIKSLDVDLTVLAGFMRILTPIFTDSINSINIHPSLLPLFKGANALERSYNSDMKVGGVTIHEVVTEVDAGAIIAQKCFDKSGLSFEEFKNKIRESEHELFPKGVLKALHASFDM